MFEKFVWSCNIRSLFLPLSALMVAMATGAMADIVFSPDSISASVRSGERVTALVTLQNTGEEPRGWTLDGVQAADGRSLEDFLVTLDQNNGVIEALIPNRFSFSEGVEGGSIGDGGNDMYDGGNEIRVTDSESGNEQWLQYSDGVVASVGGLFTGSVRYVTRKHDGLWVLAADLSRFDEFSINGGLGADGSGSVSATTMEVSHGGKTYIGFVKRVHGAGKPSVNHLVIVEDNGVLQQEYPELDTDSDFHKITGLSPTTRLYFLLYSSENGGFIDDAATEEIMRRFLGFAEPQLNWVAVTDESGSVPAGESRSLGLEISAVDLEPGTYDVDVILNVATQSRLVIPVTAVVTAPALQVNPLEVDVFAFQRQDAPLARVDFSAIPGSGIDRWTLEEDVPWLTTSAGSGSLPGGVDLEFDIGALSVGTHRAVLRIVAGEGVYTLPVKLTLQNYNITKMITGPNGAFVYALNVDGDESSVLRLDAASGWVAGTVSVRNRADDIDIDPSGTYAYVISYPGAEITRISLADWTVEAEKKAHPGSNVWNEEIAGYRIEAADNGLVFWTDFFVFSALHVYDFERGASLNGEEGYVWNSGFRDMFLSADNRTLYAVNEERHEQMRRLVAIDVSDPASPEVMEENAAFKRFDIDLPLNVNESASVFVAGPAQFDSALRETPALTYQENIVALSRDGRWALGETQIYKTETGSPVFRLPFETKAGAFTNDGAKIFAYNEGAGGIETLVLDDLLSISPFDGATVSNRLPALEFPVVNGATSYRVYVGTSKTEVSSADPRVLFGEPESSSIPLTETLEWGQTYFWRVDAQVDGKSVPGPLWSFETGFERTFHRVADSAGNLHTAIDHDYAVLMSENRERWLEVLERDVDSGLWGIGATFPIPHDNISWAWDMLDLDGARVVASAPAPPDDRVVSSAVYVYEPNKEGAWEIAGKLPPAGSPVPVGFGSSVAVSENTVVVGASLAASSDDGIEEVGAAYVYEKDFITGKWVQTATLSSGSTAPHQRFGVSIDIEGDTMVVGSGGGAKVYVFRRNIEGEWRRAYSISSPAGTNSFGSRVSMSIDSVVIADPDYWENDRQGRFLLYHLGDSRATLVDTWTGPANLAYGTDVSIGSDFAALGRGDGVVDIRRFNGETWSADTPYETGTRSYMEALDVSGGNLILAYRDEQNLGGRVVTTILSLDPGANRPPEFVDAPVLEVDEESDYRFSFGIRDESPFALAVSGEQIPDWLTLDTTDGGGVLHGTPTGADEGMHLVRIRATDDKGLSAALFFQIEVLSIDTPPMIDIAPQSKTVFENFSTSFGVVASGTRTLAYQWYRDDDPVAGATAPFFSIPGAGQEDAGSYTVKITNPVGEVTSDPVTLQVDRGDLFGGDWSTEGVGPERTGYYPATLGDVDFEESWFIESGENGGNHFDQATIADGKLFAVPLDGQRGSVAAHDLATGELLWTMPVSGEGFPSTPSYHDGKLYVQVGRSSSNSRIMALDAETGETLWSTRYHSQHETYRAPAVTDEGVWIGGGTHGGLYGYDLADGNERFFAFLPQEDFWTPTVADGRLFTAVGEMFVEHDKVTGQRLWSVSYEDLRHASATSVVADGTAVFVGSEGLHAVDIETRGKLWTKNGFFIDMPVVVDGRVYVRRMKQTDFRERLEVVMFDLESGNELASGDVDSDQINYTENGLVVTNDKILASGSTSTKFFDRFTLEPTGRDVPAAGEIAMSNGYLAVSHSENIGRLTVYRVAGSPRFTTRAPKRAYVGAPFSYLIGATAGVGSDDDLRFTLLESPEWLTLTDNEDGSALLSGAPPAAQANKEATVVVLLAQPNDLSTRQRIQLSIVSSAEPRVVEQPQGRQVFSGLTLRLGAQVDGAPPLAFQWLRDGVPLEGATSPDLVIEEIQTVSTGSYVLRATNTYGSVETNPVDVTVVPSDVVFGGDWSHSAKDSTRSGFYPAALRLTEFKELWRRFTGNIGKAVAGSGMVFVPRYENSPSLEAYALATGELAWSLPFDANVGLSEPVLFEGRLYFTLRGLDSGTTLRCVDAPTGDEIWSRALDGGEWETRSPIVSELGVHLVRGENLFGYDLNSGEELFRVTNSPFVGDASLFEGKLYTFAHNRFRCHDPRSGAELWALEIELFDQPEVKLGEGVAVLVANGEVVAIDLQTRSVRWRLPQDDFHSGCSIADGHVYVTLRGSVVALDLRDGKSVTQFIVEPGQTPYFQIVTTNDRVIASADRKTMIYDRQLGGSPIDVLDIGGDTALVDGLLVKTSNDWFEGRHGHLMVFRLDGTPVFDSQPVRAAFIDAEYIYTIEMNDTTENVYFEPGEALPDWLTLTDNGDGTAVLQGTPPAASPPHVSANIRAFLPGGIGAAQVFTITIHENASPVFIRQPIDRDTTEGFRLRLRSEARGAGPLSYQWFKNNVPIEGATDPVLSFAGVVVEDSGTYTARVSNAFGFADSEPGEVVVNPARFQFGGDWIPEGNGPARTSYYPASVGGHDFELAWQERPFGQRYLHEVAVSDGTVFVSPLVHGEQQSVSALRLDDGAVLWAEHLPQSHWMSSPVIRDGSLYLLRREPSALMALNAKTGENQWSSTIQYESNETFTPLVTDERIWVAGEYQLQGYDRSGNVLVTREQFSNDGLYPTVAEDGWVYFVAGGVFHAVDPETGETSWRLGLPVDQHFRSTISISDDMAVVVHDTVFGVDLAKRKVAWITGQGHFFPSAIADETVYVIRHDDGTGTNQFWAYDLFTGALVANGLPVNLPPESRPVVTDDYLFATSENYNVTHIYLRSNLELVKSIESGGRIGFADGTLLVTDNEGFVRAYRSSGSPEFQSAPPEHAFVGVPFEYAIDAIDPTTGNGGRLNFTSEPLPDWLSLDGDLMTGVPPEGAEGVVEIQIYAESSDGRRSGQRFFLDVRPTPRPVILSAPTSIRVYSGLVASLRIDVIGAGDLLFQWRKNGVDIEGATDREFRIDSAQVPDSGSYDVVVSNEFGTVTSDPVDILVEESDILFGGGWTTLGNDTSHNGHYPATIGGHTFNALWEKNVGSTRWSIVMEDGVMYHTGHHLGPYAAAWDVATGEEIWIRRFSDGSMNPPTLHNGVLYFQRGNHADDSQVWALDALTGEPLWSSPYEAQWQQYQAPVVTDDGVWVCGGGQGGLYKFRLTDGRREYFVELPYLENITPTMSDEGRLYTVADKLRSHNPDTGNVLWELDLPGGIEAATAVAAEGYLVVAKETLWVVDEMSREVVWSKTGQFHTMPVVFNGIVYAPDNEAAKVIAFDLRSGETLGSTSGTTVYFPGQPLATNDLFIVPGPESTRIFDRQSLEELSALPRGEHAVLSDGYLGILLDSSLVIMHQIEGAPSIVSEPVTNAFVGHEYRYEIRGENGDGTTGGLGFSGNLPDWLNMSDNGDGTALLSGTPPDEDVVRIYLKLQHESGAGTTQTFPLTIGSTPSPTVALQPQNKQTYEGIPVHFRVETLGVPPLAYQWLRDGNPIEGATASLFEIPSPILADAGRYQARITNEFGMVESHEITLTVLEDPGLIAGPWNTQGANLDRTQYYPSTVGGETFTAGWTLEEAGEIGAIAEGKVFIRQSNPHRVLALDGRTGETLWSFQAGNLELSAPSYHRGSVYLRTQTHLVALDTTTGETLWQTPVNAGPTPPTVSDSGVIVLGEGGVYKYDRETGRELFFSPFNEGYAFGVATIDPEGRLFVYSGGWFRQLDPDTGAILWEQQYLGDLVDSGNVSSRNGVAVVVETNDYRLVGIDIANRKEVWRTEETHLFLPAVAYNKVYTWNRNDGTLEVYDLFSGEKLDTITHPENNAFLGSPLLTKDRIVIGDHASKTLVFDRQSHALLQTLDGHGSLALSDGLLVIGDIYNSIRTYTLPVDGQSPPVITSNPELEINEDTTYTYTLRGSSSDGTITFSAPDLPGWLALVTDGDDTLLRGIPGQTEVGTHNITIVATDSANQSVSQMFALTVTEVNDAPVFGEIPDERHAEDTSHIVPLFAFASDEEEDDTLEYSVIANDNPGLFSLAQTDGNLLNLIPAPNAFGEAILTLRVMDSGGLTDETDLRVVFTPVNDAPVGTALEPIRVEEDFASFDVDVSAAFSDPEQASDTLDYEWLQVSPKLEVRGSAESGVLTLSPVANANGMAVVQILATDNEGASATIDLTVDITPVNDPPHVAMVFQKQVTEEDSAPITLNLNDHFDDIESGPDDLTFDIEARSAEEVSLMLDGRMLVLTPRPDAHGEGSVTVIASDPQGDTVASELEYSIAPVPDAPRLVSPLQPVTAAADGSPDSIDLEPFFFDPDFGDSLGYVVSTNTNPDLFSGITIEGGVLQLNYADYLSGGATFTLRATDATGLSVETELTVTVPPIPAPEVIPDAAPILNRQTGLFEQRILVTNNAARAIGGFVVTIADLIEEVEAYNATGLSPDGLPLLEYHVPVGSGESVEIVVEFHSKKRTAPETPDYRSDTALPMETMVSNVDDAFAIDRVLRLKDGGMLIEFTSEPDATFRVQYSDDGETWLDSPVSIRASANRVMWIDYGPPRTHSAPQDSLSRLYRCFREDTDG